MSGSLYSLKEDSLSFCFKPHRERQRERERLCSTFKLSRRTFNALKERELFKKPDLHSERRGALPDFAPECARGAVSGAQASALAQSRSAALRALHTARGLLSAHSQAQLGEEAARARSDGGAAVRGRFAASREQIFRRPANSRVAPGSPVETKIEVIDICAMVTTGTFDARITLSSVRSRENERERESMTLYVSRLPFALFAVTENTFQFRFFPREREREL